ncbi:MAG TPA: hypothetical protein VH877_03525 [Polyangia bacterium]|jgi:hypothetical protein|nr:hypothetical protein [Polyangia bacterium]
MKRTLSTLIALSTLAIAGSAHAGDTCAYVMGTINSKLVATPAVLVTTPDVSAAVSPARVVVDQSTQQILGYRLSLPGEDVILPENGIFVPGQSWLINTYAASLAAIGLGNYTCVNLGVTTPAVPIFVPASYLQVPGVASDVPGVTLNIGNKQVTVPGRTVSLPSHTVVIPQIDETVAPIHVETPNQTVAIEFAVRVVAKFMPALAADSAGLIDSLP